MNTNIINRIKEVAQEYMSMGVSADKAFELATEAVKLESAPAKPARKGTGKPAPAPEAKPELVEFVKADGSKVKCTPAQAKAWSKWRDREHMSLDEVKALKPEITDAGREYVKAHPLCTRKEAAANGCKNITKEGLKALKVELGFKR